MSKKLTPGVKKWLEKLRDEGPCKRSRGRVGYIAMQAGWTEWDYHRKDNGQPITTDEARATFGDQWWEQLTNGDLDRITPAGRVRLVEVDNGR